MNHSVITESFDYLHKGVGAQVRVSCKEGFIIKGDPFANCRMMPLIERPEWNILFSCIPGNSVKG